MRQYLPWTIAIIATIAFVASFSELQRLRTRFGELTHHKFHDHQDVRRFIISVELAETTMPIVVLGDSITEMARLPVRLCGHPVVNAGVGGANASDLSYLVPPLLRNHQPRLIVVVMGANDVGDPDLQSQYESLYALLEQKAETIAVSSTANTDVIKELKAAAKASQITYVDIAIPTDDLIDGIHFKRTGYAEWLPQLSAAITGALHCDTGAQESDNK